jgi:hypothetical protein
VGASVIVTGISRVMMSLKPDSTLNLEQSDHAAST